MEKEETLAFWKFLTSGEWRVARKDWRSSEYLKRNQGLYAREDGRHWNEDGRRCSEVLKSSYMKTVVK